LSTLFALPPVLRVLGRLSEAGAAAAFVWHIWPRVVGREG
jgi:hypothetical protein